MSTRNAEIIEKRKAGATVQSIADEYGITKQRVSQICRKGDRKREQRGDNCPRCGAAYCHQKWVNRTKTYSEYENAADMNPVDGVICPGCGFGFRVSRLETDNFCIVDWQTEFEFVPNYCPHCGARVRGGGE